MCKEFQLDALACNIQSIREMYSLKSTTFDAGNLVWILRDRNRFIGFFQKTSKLDDLQEQFKLQIAF